MKVKSWKLWILVIAGYFLVSAALAADAVVKKGNKVTNKEWGISISAPGIKIWQDYPYRNSAPFILAANIAAKKCHVNISMRAISMPIGETAVDCWNRGRISPKMLRDSPKNMKVFRVSEKPVPHSLYDMMLDRGKKGKGSIVNNQLWAYWARGDQCIVLHVSSVQCHGFGKLAKPLLQAVKIDRKRDTTVETVSLGRLQKLASDGWQSHLLAASYYLHRAKPPRPAKARRFFLSSQRLSKNKNNIMQQWSIEEGVGLSYLMQQNGDKALTPLQTALRIARQGGKSRIRMLSSTLHNLACAQSLTRKTAKSCASLQELLSVAPVGTVKAVLKQIKQDPQLKNVRKAACYKKVLVRRGKGV